MVLKGNENWRSEYKEGSNLESSSNMDIKHITEF